MNISFAGTSEIQDYQFSFQESLLNSFEVIFHSMNEEMNETNLSTKLMVETYSEETGALKGAFKWGSKSIMDKSLLGFFFVVLIVKNQKAMAFKLKMFFYLLSIAKRLL